jgi:hypothetical protein
MHYVSTVRDQNSRNRDFLSHPVHDKAPSIEDLSPTDHANTIVSRKILGNLRCIML